MVPFSIRATLRALPACALATGLVFAVSMSSGVLAQDDPRIAQAREAGPITWYTAAFPTDMREALINAFQEQTGLQISVYAGGGGQILSRLRTERQTGAYSVDVVDAGDVDVDELVKDGVLKTYTPKGAEMIHEDFKHPEGYYYGMYFWTLVLQYNSNFYNKDTAPATFEDLADPQFKGKVVAADPARSTAGLGFVKTMVAQHGWDWIEQFVENEPLIMSITSGIQPAVVAGERPISVMTSQFTSKTMEDGGPIALSTDEALFGSPDVLGILEDAPNPVGAELLVEFLLSKEAQELIRQYGPYSTRIDVAAPYGMPELTDVELRYKRIPDVAGMSSQEVAEQFQSMLRAAR